jgi:histidine triad (HIT) family protein
MALRRWAFGRRWRRPRIVGAMSPAGASAVGPGDCVFCDIVAGAVAAHEVWRDDVAVAFLDRSPLFPGHTLVVPVRHVVTLADLPPAEVGPYFARVQLVAAAMPAALGAQGTFVANNNVVSQSVAHLHVHVVPRTRGDGLRGFFWPRRKYAAGEAERCARLLRDALVAT